MNTIKAISLVFAVMAVVMCACMASTASSADTGDPVVTEESVAQIGDTKYASLNEAFAAISASSETSITVTLINDCTESNNISVPAGKDVTLNLNGKTIICKDNNGRLFDVSSSSFTIDGTCPGSKIEVYKDASGYNQNVWGFIKIIANSVVTLDGGEYTGPTYKGAFVKILDEAPNSVVTIRNANMTTDSWIFDTEYLEPSKQTATLTVIGGTYKSVTENTTNDGKVFTIRGNENVTARFEGATIESTVGGPGVLINDNAPYQSQLTVYITDCMIKVTGSNNSYCNSAVAVSFGANAVINGGTYTGTNGYGAYVFSSGGTLTVEAGTFVGGKAAIAADHDDNKYSTSRTTVYFKNGTTDGTHDWQTNNSKMLFITVSGGTHRFDVPKDYLPQGYKSALTSSGLYEVGVDLSLSFSVENNRRGETIIQPVPSTEATIDATKTEVEWTFEGQHYSDSVKIAPTQAGLYTATVTVYDENGNSGTATASYQFNNTHTVTLKYDGTEKTLTVIHNSTIANLPTPGKSHYSYMWTDADGSEFKSTDKVIRDLDLTATLVMSDIDVEITYVREDGNVYIQAVCTPAVDVSDMIWTWAIDYGDPSAVDRVELTNESRHYRFEMSAKTSDGTLARAVWEDDLCKTTGSSTETIQTDSEKVSIVPSDISDTAIDQTIDFNMPDIAEDEKVTISIKGNISDTGSTVDVSVQDITQNGQTWTDGMSAAVDVSVSNVRNGYSLEITVKVQIPSNYLGAVAYYYNEARGCLEKVNSTIDEDTGLVTIYTDHNTPYVVQVLTTDSPDPVVPDEPDTPDAPNVPIYDDGDDWYPVYPTVTDNNRNDDSKTAVACAAAAAVAALMAAFLVIDSRKDR